jgi:CRP-like cAMP-binding protein
MESKTFNPGDVIFRQGGASDGEAYLVHEGAVEVRKSEDGEERILRKLGKGDLLGEVALFRSAPHSATAIAIEPVTLLVIPEDRLEDMVRTNPELAIALIRQLAGMAAGEEPKSR